MPFFSRIKCIDLELSKFRIVPCTWGLGVGNTWVGVLAGGHVCQSLGPSVPYPVLLRRLHHVTSSRTENPKLNWSGGLENMFKHSITWNASNTFKLQNDGTVLGSPESRGEKAVPGIQGLVELQGGRSPASHRGSPFSSHTPLNDDQTSNSFLTEVGNNAHLTGLLWVLEVTMGIKTVLTVCTRFPQGLACQFLIPFKLLQMWGERKEKFL